MTARCLAARPEARARGIRVVAYDPGPKPGIGLVRAQGALPRLAWTALATPTRWLLRGGNTVGGAGQVLAALALGRVAPPKAASRRRSGVGASPARAVGSRPARRPDGRALADSADLVRLPG